MDVNGMSGSDTFGSRWGLIFATIGAAIGTGNIWRFPRMVGANGGGSFLIPWLIFLFAWSIPLIIAEFAIGKRARTGTVGAFRIFAGRRFAWMGLWTAWISTAIGFYYAIVAGWCIKYVTLGVSGALQGVDGPSATQIWNDFLQNPGQVIFFQFLVVGLTLLFIWRGAKAIEKVNTVMMLSLFALLFLALGMALWMDFQDGSPDGFTFMFSVDPAYLGRPETWISALSQSAWSCSAGMGMAITYAVYMRKDEDTTLNAFTMGLANNSISIIAGLAVMSAIFAVMANPLSAVSGGSSAITFLTLPVVFAEGLGGAAGWFMVTVFFLALSFAAITSMISTVELCVRNFQDHGIERSKAVGFTGTVIFIFGMPSAFLWIKLDAAKVAFPQFLEVQDHIWGYGLMFSGLFIAYSIVKFGVNEYLRWRERTPGVSGRWNWADYLAVGVPAFRREFINTGENDMWIGRWWDGLIYLFFPVAFLVLMLSYFADLIANVEDPFAPLNPHGVTIILLFWGITGTTFILLNKYLLINRWVYTGDRGWLRRFLDLGAGHWHMEPRPVHRNVPEGADVDISNLPGGDDGYVLMAGDELPEVFDAVEAGPALRKVRGARRSEVLDAELDGVVASVLDADLA